LLRNKNDRIRNSRPSLPLAKLGITSRQPSGNPTTPGDLAMNEAKEKDNFWLYVGVLTAVLVAVILTVKNAERDKYAEMQKLEDEEKSLMNIRVIKDY